MSDQQPVGFGGAAFSREVEAILAVADRGYLYPHETRLNLAKAGVIIDDEIPLPNVDINAEEAS